eukprot:366110-Chlamydomonas_euryale.AAC.5
MAMAVVADHLHGAHRTHTRLTQDHTIYMRLTHDLHTTHTRRTYDLQDRSWPHRAAALPWVHVQLR